VGFGIASTGDMYPAGIMIGWISEGNMYLGVVIYSMYYATIGLLFIR